MEQFGANPTDSSVGGYWDCYLVTVILVVWFVYLKIIREMEISLEDTAVGRKKIVLEQQLNAATLSMSPTKWNELLEIRKRKWGKEGVVGAAEEVIGGAEGV
mgnify:CR=1 FL=1